MSEITYVGLKLVTGEEVIAAVSATTDDGLVCEKVRTLVAQEVKPGELGMRFIPWLFSAPDVKIGIAFDDIVTAFQPEQNIVDAYIKQTSALDLSTMSSKQIVTG